jgi:hypothetical protein
MLHTYGDSIMILINNVHETIKKGVNLFKV